MYDPGIGRWLQEDPSGFAAGDTNLYRYAHNNPTNAVDPSGLQENYPIGSMRPQEFWEMLQTIRLSRPTTLARQQWAFDAIYLLHNARMSPGEISQALGPLPLQPPPIPRGAPVPRDIESIPFENWLDLPRQFDENVTGREAAEMAHRLITRDFPIHAGTQVFNIAMPVVVGRTVSLSARLVGQGYQIVMQNGRRVLARRTGQGLQYLTDGEAAQVLSRLVEMHHPIPRFLGGTGVQTFYAIAERTHRGSGSSFHNMLRDALRRRGLDYPVGGRNGSSLDWAGYITRTPNGQRHAFDAIFDASREFDQRYGTRLTTQVWENIIGGQFRAIP